MDELSRGEALFESGDLDGAERCFRAALAANPKDARALSNLAVVAFQAGRLGEAVEALERALEHEPEHRPSLANYVDACIAHGDPRRALPALGRLLRAHPHDPELVQLLLQVAGAREHRLRIVFASDDPTVHALAAELASVFEVRPAGEDAADAVWIEADETGAEISRRLPRGPKLVCHVRDGEGIAERLRRIRWERVDQVIAGSSRLARLVAPHPAFVVPDGVDLERFAFVERGPGRRLACVGPEREPALLLHAFGALLRRDPGYELHVAGDDGRMRDALEQLGEPLGLAGRVHIDGRVEDLAPWLADKQLIVASAPIRVFEGMARGLKPVVQATAGTDELFPRRYTWRTIPEFVDRVTASDDRPAEYRDFVARHCSWATRLAALLLILDADDRLTPLSFATPPEPDPGPAATPRPWSFPKAVFDPSPRARIPALFAEAVRQIEAGRPDLARVTLERVARMTGYRSDTVLQRLAELYAKGDDIPALKEMWKRVAVAMLEDDRIDDFLRIAYVSIYAEQLYSKAANYRHATVDWDLHAFVRMAGQRTALAGWVREHRTARAFVPRPGKIRVGFVLEGLSAVQAPSRSYMPLIEHFDRDRYEVFVYSRWSHQEPVAQKESYDQTARRYRELGCAVRHPDRPLSPLAQVDFLARRIVEDRIDALVYQSVYFVPQYDLLASLRPAPFQAAVEHQQSEFHGAIDLVFTVPKLYLEARCRVAPFAMASARPTVAAAVPRASVGLPDDAVVLVSANRGVRYQQPSFWQEVARLLERHPAAWFLAIGLDAVGDLLPAAAPCRGRIVTPGFRSDVMELLSLADVYVDLFPSGGGLSIVEGMQAGLPCVCFDDDMAQPYSLLDVQVGTQFTGDPDLIVPPGDHRRWHAIMDRLVTDAGWRREKGRAMRERARAFVPATQARQFFDHLEDAFAATCPCDQEAT
jgi:glycosyltransferase involved in cell wall biosynthesis